MENAPDTRSSDYIAMLDYWQMVSDLTNGADAMRAAGERYLDRFESEDLEQYKKRLSKAVYTNIYSDIVESLAARPFSNEISLVDGSPRVKALAEDIDGQGNNMHNFSATFFRNALDYGVDWIYVDYTRTKSETIDASGRVRRKTIAEERADNARPYWVRVPATDMIAVYSAIIDGREEFVHCRMMETYIERSGWEEVTVTQIREIDRQPMFDEDGQIIDWDNAVFRVWRQQDQEIMKNGKLVRQRQVWTVVDEGPMAIGVIPIVPLVIGERKGNGWQIVPAMKSCAYLQVDYYDEENGLKNIKKITAYPMLTASGVTPEKDSTGAVRKAPVGPRAVLYGPATEHGTGTWSFIEPAGSSLTFLRDELKEKAKELRELGRQPLTQSSSQLTRVTSSAAASKGTAAIQRWALAMKDALENAMFYTALWLNEGIEPTVSVNTNFSLEDAEDDGFADVLALRSSGDLSQETIWEEAKRRGRLSDEFTVEREQTRLEGEMPSDDDLLPEDVLPEDEITSPDPGDGE